MHVLGGGSDAVIFEKVHKFRKVDYRTIQYIIFENVKFEIWLTCGSIST